MNILVQKASRDLISSHIPVLLEIDRENFKENWKENNFLSDLKGKFDHSYIAICNQNVVGYSINYLSSESILHISRIAVKKALKGQGIGRKIIERVVADSKSKRLKAITLEFDVLLGVANFYHRLGFKEMEDEEVKNYLILKGKPDKTDFYLGNNSSRKVLELILLK